MSTAIASPPRAPYVKSKAYFVRVLRRQAEKANLPADAHMMLVGGSESDAAALASAGFTHLALSALGETCPDSRSMDCIPGVDVQSLPFADGAYDAVFAHEVLHHCRQPHLALCEMLRVARRHVIFLEPNDSGVMRFLVAAGYSLPFEIPAVVDNGYVRGGVMDSCIPNFIFRWNPRTVHDTVASFLPEEVVVVSPYPYWDFNANERDIELRAQTRLGALARLVGGGRNLLVLLRAAQRVLNLVPPLRRQGNKMLCILEKTGKLRPWLRRHSGGIEFDPDFKS